MKLTRRRTRRTGKDWKMDTNQMISSEEMAIKMSKIIEHLAKM